MKNIKWKGSKQEFIAFATDYVADIHNRCTNPQTPEDHQLRKDMENVEIMIVCTVNGVDVLEIRFVIKSATDFYDEDKTHIENMIAFAKMHVQACKEDIAGSIEYDQDKALHRQSILQAYPETNIN